MADLVARGAYLVQAGTTLRCPESGAPSAQRDALADPAFEGTAVTRAFSDAGRAAWSTPRCGASGGAGRLSRFNAATRPLRAAAAQAGDAQHMSLYADRLPPGRGATGSQGGRAPGVGTAPVSSGRQTRTIEFTPPDEAGVADALRMLRDASGGWVNLLPGIDEEASDASSGGAVWGPWTKTRRP